MIRSCVTHIFDSVAYNGDQVGGRRQQFKFIDGKARDIEQVIDEPVLDTGLTKGLIKRLVEFFKCEPSVL
jgi:hypothetical protein